MIVLLSALTLFNVVAGIGSFALALRLVRSDERKLWRSRTLLRIADALAWVFPIAAVAGTVLAWTDYRAGNSAAALLAFIPLAWLLFMGLVFAIVDFAEDGVLGNARGPTP